MNERRSDCRDPEDIITRDDVRDFYSNAAVSTQESLCCPVDYNEQLLSHIPKEVLEISYGCGSPMDRAGILPGETIADLGSGGGIDCFIASKLVRKEGRVYGIDMTEEMLNVARKNAQKVGKNLGYCNVEFKQGFLEAIPLEKESTDLVTSNCVINLSTDKNGVFNEIRRILKPGGRFLISDIISDKVIPEEMRQNKELWGECISGALTLDEFITIARQCKFSGLTIRKDYLWKRVNEINFYSFILEGYRLDKSEKSDYQTIRVVYAGPFSSVTIEGNIFEAGKAVEINSNFAEFLKGTPFRNHFNIFDPNEQVSEENDSSCCG